LTVALSALAKPARSDSIIASRKIPVNELRPETPYRDGDHAPGKQTSIGGWAAFAATRLRALEFRFPRTFRYVPLCSGESEAWSPETCSARKKNLRNRTMNGQQRDDEFAHVIRLAPLVSIDLIIRDGEQNILVALRTNEPAKGLYFVPGGRIRKDETIANAFVRILANETGCRLC
jgi:hypothetical protein